MVEPGDGGGHGGVEDSAGSEGTADSLREDELVVFSGERGHHQTKDVEEGSDKQ